MYKTTIYTLALCLWAGFMSAQVSGRIIDTAEPDEGLPFATVYVKNSTLGTTSNAEGYYELPLEPGSHELVFQYVGYRQRTEKVEVSNAPLSLDISLTKESVELGEVVVTTDGEDPAYAIIRKAMARRTYYLNQVKEYSCDVYMKGNQRVENMPKKFMGQEIGDLGGMLDSTGTGILYLSESVSKLYHQAPDQFKEEMISSKVSGNDQGFSFNQASAMDFDFYKNTYDELNRSIVSPIAENAFVYYKYRLEGAYYDKSGHLINKIRVFRKRDTDPSLAGYIYIIDELWSIHSVDMWSDGKAFGIPILDTLYLKQLYVPVREPNVWQVFSRMVSFKGKVFGIKLDGVFSAMYRNYNLEPNLGKDFFDTEILKVIEGANERDSSYWAAIRPIPLLEEEIRDYAKKDSLQIIWESKEYLDSMDRKSNKFKIMNLLGGYTFNRSYRQWSLGVRSPVSTISYNTVQGFNMNLGMNFQKEFDKNGYRWLKLTGAVQYGFSDKQPRGTLGFDHKLNSTNFAQFGMEGGRTATQFNGEDLIRPLPNAMSGLFFRRNYTKYYDRYYGRFNGSSELFNGFLVKGFLEYAHRKPLQNQSDYSFFFRETRDYTSNDPQDANNYDEPSFSPHEAITVGLDIRIRFQQEYLSYPNRKFITGSKYPDFWIQYRRGIPILGGDTNYDFLSLAIKDAVRIGGAGHSFFNFEGGGFLSEAAVPFVDWHHFNGSRMYFNFTSRYLDQFRMLEYYDYSTTRFYFKAHWEHSFGGTILGKIPGVRKLQWELVTGSSYLYSDEFGHYGEFHVGFNRIGFGLFRLFRVDFVTRIWAGGTPEYRVMTGLDF